VRRLKAGRLPETEGIGAAGVPHPALIRPPSAEEFIWRFFILFGAIEQTGDDRLSVLTGGIVLAAQMLLTALIALAAYAISYHHLMGTLSDSADSLIPGMGSMLGGVMPDGLPGGGKLFGTSLAIACLAIAVTVLLVYALGKWSGSSISMRCWIGAMTPAAVYGTLGTILSLLLCCTKIGIGLTAFVISIMLTMLLLWKTYERHIGLEPGKALRSFAIGWSLSLIACFVIFYLLAAAFAGDAFGAGSLIVL
jgi:hypothetical protein